MSKLLQVNYENDVHLLQNDCKLLLADQNNERGDANQHWAYIVPCFCRHALQLQLVQSKESVFIFHVLRQEAHNRDIAAGRKRWPQGEMVKQSSACLYISCRYVYQSLMTLVWGSKEEATSVRDGSLYY